MTFDKLLHYNQPLKRARFMRRLYNFREDFF